MRALLSGARGRTETALARAARNHHHCVGRARAPHHLQGLRHTPVTTASAAGAPASGTAQQLAPGGMAQASSRRDASSFANPHEARVTHTHLELSVDFDTKVLKGYAQLLVQAVADAPSRLTLDTRDLTIHSVQLAGGDGSTPQPLQHSFGDRHEALGTPLHVQLSPGLAAGAQVTLGIRFTCSPASTALQFLEPSQTAGGQHPYLFTQCQAIHARSLLPCQDTPAVKSSYSAAVRVPAALRALMSAVPCDAPPALPHGPTPAAGVPHLPAAACGGASGAGSSSQVHYFHQQVPIPSYLIALAVGQLEGRQLSDRSTVWSEPSVVDAAAFEFADTADYLRAAEEIAGPYVWGRYDLLVLPPSFPFGGMENPTLTFVTPTLLAGDRSLTNVVAHEIAHSWTGNLVTNASWESFWLNEGWTVFLERKIVGRLRGEATLQFQAQQGALALEAEIQQIGPQHNFTRLCPDLSDGADPDDAFSRVPYEKGFYFLYYLQQLVGGPAAFEPFMRHYLDTFAFGAVDSTQFRRAFCDFFRDAPAAATVDWDTWLHAPGMPPVVNAYDASLAQAACDLASAWHTADVMGIGAAPPAAATPHDLEGWGCAQVVAFLDKLGELRSLQPLAPAMCRAMNQLYRLDDSTNCEIRCSWYKLCIAAQDATIYPHVVDMLSSQGRMKYLRPLYRALYRSGPEGKAVALDTFKAASHTYFPVAAKMVEADLHLRPAAAATP